MLSSIRQSKKQKGFTIIEVLIVLAIAGLILLVVFLAVPALQRNARNQRRTNDVANLLGGMSEYVNNNNGSAPANATTLGTAGATTATIGAASGVNQTTVNLGYYDPSNVSIGSTAATTNPNDAEKVIIVKGGKCSGGDSVSGGPTRGFVALYTLENNSKQCKES